jgi:hypothetical protein
VQLRYVAEKIASDGHGSCRGAQCRDGDMRFESTNEFLQHEHGAGNRRVERVAKPAPAPAAIKTRQSGQLRRVHFPMQWARLAPICTLGPSRPSTRPVPMESTPPRNFTGTSRAGAGGSLPSRTASVCGIPLPEACGANRRTSQAASAVTAAQDAMMISAPKGTPRDQLTSVLRKSLAWSSASRKRAPTNPAAAPTTSDNSASTTKLPRSRAVRFVTSAV